MTLSSLLDIPSSTPAIPQPYIVPQLATSSSSHLESVQYLHMSRRVATSSPGLTSLIRGPLSAPAIHKVIEKLRSFTQLRTGWDGGAAPPPSNLACALAENLLLNACERNLEPQRVAPSVAGGIGITYRQGKRRGYIEVYNDGLAYLMLSHKGDEPSIAPFDAEEAALDQLREFLHHG